jgi:hypothetical protein
MLELITKEEDIIKYNEILELVTEENEIEKCQKFLEKTIKNNFNQELFLKDWKFNHNNEKDIWYWTGSWQKDGFDWYLNEFGLLNDLLESKERVIIAAFNIKIKGKVNIAAGGFAKNENGQINLIHRGNFCRIKKKVFFDWYKSQSQNFLGKINEYGKIKDVVIIGDIESENFIRNLTLFIKSVSEFKYFINEETNLIPEFLIPEVLRHDFENIDIEKIEQVIFVHKRNQKIVEKAKKLAAGKCQLCDYNAPFNKDNEPYLEVHHIEWLSENGADSIENTVALCPNCHRKMHALNLDEDIEKLKKITSSYNL